MENRNFKTEDLVLISNETCIVDWLLVRITEIGPSGDDLVQVKTVNREYA